MDAQDSVTSEVIARALGEELRRAREAGGWSRPQFVARLPSGIGDRTLLSYEHGARHLTVARLIELCSAAGVAAPDVLALALQRARMELRTLGLQVDLYAVLRDNNATFQGLAQWAGNRLANDDPDGSGVVTLAPAALREMAAVFGCSQSALAEYLATFPPEAAPSH